MITWTHTDPTAGCLPVTCTRSAGGKPLFTKGGHAVAFGSPEHEELLAEMKGLPVPERCPGAADPRCRSACTLVGESGEDGGLLIGEGARIMDPDCFR